MKQIGPYWTDFHEIWYLSIFRQSVEKIQVSLKSDNIKEHFAWRTIYIYDHILPISSWYEKCFRQKLYRKSKRTFLFKNFFLLKSWRLWYRAEKFCRPGQATDDRMAYAHCMLANKGYRHTLRICNTLLFHSSIGYTSVPVCYVIRSSPV